MSTDPSYDQTHWIAVRRRGPLPTYYYHEHFMEMLSFVERHYAHALLQEHRDFLSDFRALQESAQCLYVRLVNRKGRLFAANKLSYPELGDTLDILRRLYAAGFVDAPDASHFRDVLRYLTRAEITDTLLQIVTGASRTMKKAALLEFVCQHCEASEFMAILDTDRLLVQKRVDAVRYLLFLYFGRVQDGLSQFTMRDLGLVKTQSFRDSYEPRFQDRAEALEHYFFSRRLHAMRQATAGDEQRWHEDLSGWPEPNFSASAAVRDQLAAKLGRWLEKSGHPDKALDAYQQGESSHCSERAVRLLIAADRRDDAEAFLGRCIDNPRSDEEALMAEDLYARKFRRKRTSSLTDELRNAETIPIDEAMNGAPERAAIRYFQDRGMQAYRTENQLWRTLFGLLFWDELFASDAATLHSPFEFLPSALSDGSFYARHHEAIETRLGNLDNKRKTQRQLLKCSTRHYGTNNGVFRWRRSIIEAIFALLENAAPEAIAGILRGFCQDYQNARYGYPDLLVIDAAGIRFVEIKAEGDQLRRNQLLRLQQLRNAGLRADVVRVQWVLDPEQTYVVVDVETTGGRGAQHRVTEIGAVKVKKGTVVDKFETLLNPQRAIPTNITRLTGISAAMVADAPLFIEIADDFETFMEDAIFVAHNVNFDYRFIAQEFKRIGRPFRHARLCTCASMRKLYPGHRSYSLAALCSHFDIDLRRHHRALCDAEAAAELLLLINDKRASMLSTVASR